MTDAPERIWAKVDHMSADMSGAMRVWGMDAPFGEGRKSPPTPYVRADLHEALAAENARLVHDIERAQTALSEMATDNERLREDVGVYLAVWAVRHAEMNGLAEGELHPQHFDRMAELGCRMDSFRRAALKPPS